MKFYSLLFAVLMTASGCVTTPDEKPTTASNRPRHRPGKPSVSAAATTTKLVAASLVMNKGSKSSQPLSVLSVQDQSGTVDGWSKYIEFTPVSTGLTANFIFNVPAGVTPTALTVKTNYKGRRKGSQLWGWKLYNFTTGTWVTVGDNTPAASWTWTPMSFPVPAPLSRFMNASRQIKLRFDTFSGVDLCDIDYLVIEATTDVVPPPPPPPSGTWWKPTPGIKWQMQYTGTIDINVNAPVYFLDTFFSSKTLIDQVKAKGRKVICYINGGSWESYAPDAASFPASVIGKGVSGWADEKFIDIRQVDILWAIMLKRIDMAQQKGCDGFYHDWAHIFTEDTGFPITAADQIKWNTLFATEGHKRNMSVGLINDLLQVKELVNLYDWGMIESCNVYNECAYENPFIAQNKAVFALEYQGDPAAVCPKLNALNFDGQYKHLLLDAWKQDCR